MFNTLGNSIPRNSLVWEWLLDGNTLDTSWNWNNWTTTNVTYIKTDRGYQSQAGSFNGSNSRVTAGINWITNWDKTVSIWVKWTNDSGTANTQHAFNVWANRNNVSNWTINFSYSHGNSDFQRAWAVSNTSNNYFPIKYNTQLFWWIWYHLIYTQSWNTARCYLNWILENTVTLSWIIDSPSQTIIWSWRSWASYLSYFNWQIQWVRIYNRAISQDEIQLLYLEWKRLLWPTNIAKYPSLLSGLVWYWDFRWDASNLVDWVKWTVNGATLTSDRFWNSDSAYAFNWVSNTILATTLDYFWTQNLSISSHIYISSLPSSWNITMPISFVEWAIDNGTYDKSIEINSSWQVSFRLYDWVNKTATYNWLITWQWYHIVWTYDWINIRIYVNLVEWTPKTATWSYNFTTPKLWFSWNWWWSRIRFNWKIWETMLFNKALSANEVKTLYNLTSQDYIYPTPSYDLENLRDWLVLDLNEQWQDLSWNGNNGFLVNLAYPQWLRQWRIKGLNYNGNNAYIRDIWINNITLWNSDKTIALWIKPWYTADRVMYRLWSSWTNTQLWLSLHTANEIKAYIFGWPNILSWIIATKIHHIVLSKNWNEYKLYVDWVLRNTTTYANLNITWTDHQVWALWATYHWSWWIFNPRVRNRALSDKEIQALYYSQNGNFIY